MKQDYFSNDVKNLLTIFHTNSLQYVIVGEDAVIYYGFGRLTGDTDIYYSLTDENVSKLYKALLEFFGGGNIPGIENKKELEIPGTVVQFGVPPNEIIVIEHTLRYSDVPEIKAVIDNYGMETCKRVWEQKLIPDERMKKLNHFLA